MGEGLRFALEHADTIVVDVPTTADDFQGHRALRVLLLGLVDDRHAALTKLPHDAEVADQRGHSWTRLRGRRGIAVR